MSESRRRAWEALDIGPAWRLREQPGVAVAPGQEGGEAVGAGLDWAGVRGL